MRRKRPGRPFHKRPGSLRNLASRPRAIPSILPIPQSFLRAVVVTALWGVRLRVGERVGGADAEPFSVTSVTSVVTLVVCGDRARHTVRVGTDAVAAEDVAAR